MPLHSTAEPVYVDVFFLPFDVRSIAGIRRARWLLVEGNGSWAAGIRRDHGTRSEGFASERREG